MKLSVISKRAALVLLLLSQQVLAQMANPPLTPTQQGLQKSNEAIIKSNTESVDANKKAGNAAAVGDAVLRGPADIAVPGLGGAVYNTGKGGTNSIMAPPVTGQTTISPTPK
jgi:hypothetical protein